MRAIRLFVGAWPAVLAVGYIALGLTVFMASSSWGNAREAQTLSRLLAGVESGEKITQDAPRLTFIFSLRDCWEALRPVRGWSALHESHRLRVRGLMVDAPDGSQAIESYLGRAGIRFPVDTDPDSRLVSAVASLGFGTTPITILSDARHRPRLILPATLDSLAQLGQAELLRAQVDQLWNENRLERRWRRVAR